MIIFENDEIGTVNSGIVFLRSGNIQNVSYAIVRPQDKNVLKLFKWNGSAWREL
jgi:hypothetical protein